MRSHRVPIAFALAGALLTLTAAQSNAAQTRATQLASTLRKTTTVNSGTVTTAGTSATGTSTNTGTVPSTASTAAMTGVSIPGNRLLWESDAQLSNDLNAVRATGASWLRIDVAWSELEGTQGQVDWARFDRVVDAATARGLKINGIVTTMAPWARPATADWRYGPTTSLERQRFASFARQAAARYKGRIDTWEVWNEPNLHGFWAPKPSSAGYNSLFSLASSAIKKANPSATVLTGGTGGADYSTGSSDLDSVEWYRQLISRGTMSSATGAAVHPYTGLNNAATGEMSQAKKIRALLDSNGLGSLPIWGTEVGNPTAGENSLTESQAAEIMPATLANWQSIRAHGPLFWYTLADSDDPSREGHFGLLRRDGSAKPGYSMLQTLTGVGGSATDGSALMSEATDQATGLALDRNAPSVEITGPAGGPLPAGQFTITAEASDDRGLRSVQVVSNGRVLATSSTAPFALPISTADLQFGQIQQFTVIATDTAGNVATTGLRTRIPQILVNSVTLTGSTMSATVIAPTPIAAQTVIVAVRDSAGRNYDKLLATGASLSTGTTLSAAHSGLATGTYQYWLAYYANGIWTDLNAPLTVTVR